MRPVLSVTCVVSVPGPAARQALPATSACVAEGTGPGRSDFTYATFQGSLDRQAGLGFPLRSA